MWKKGILNSVILAILVLSTISIIPIGKAEASNGNTFYVGGSGPGNYTTIQSAIDNASDGDTVFVYSGIYYENVEVDKNLDLIGENKNTTIIDAIGNGGAMYVTANGVNISGFTVTNSTEQYIGGITLNQVQHCQIFNVITTANNAGIRVAHSNNNSIYNCIVKENAWGIHLYYSSHNDIINNSVHDNTNLSLYSSGIYIYPSSHNNIISQNTIINNKNGIYIWSSDNNTANKNIIKNNSGSGLRLGYHSGGTCSYNDIHSNTLENNGYGIYSPINSINNLIYHNNLINNVDNAYDEGDNQWDYEYPLGGNYWNDFDESSEGAFDNDSDGIIDMPYFIPEGDNLDRYPLINPWSYTPPLAPVHNINKDTYYLSIQEAIDEANPGNTILVSSGIYYENIVLHTSLTLLGEHNGTTIIDASGYSDVIAVVTSNCTITGFTIINSGDLDGGHINCGIYCDDYSPLITNNIIAGNNIGIGCWDGASPIIQDNILTNNTNSGIYAYACSPHIENNSFICNGNAGITLRANSTATIIGNVITRHPKGINCNYVTGYSTHIRNNYIFRNQYGIQSDGSYNITLCSNTVCNNSENGFAFSYASSHNTIDNNIFFNNSDSSIGLSKSCTNNTIINNTFRQSHVGINISSSHYNTLRNNTILANQLGIDLTDSSTNTISDNNFSHNDVGLSVAYSQDNLIIDNTFISNVWGAFSITDSSDNTLSNNSFFNDGITCSYSSSKIIAKDYTNTVSNNTVNGKPLIYLIGESDSIITDDAGQLILIGCNNITLQSQAFSNTPVGVQLIDTNNCLISGEDITHNRYGVRILYSHNNTFIDGTISHNIVGIYIYRGTGNIILNNTITHTNGRGVFLHFSNNNAIINNTVSNNNEGITIYSSSDNNILYHNNMINNTLQAYDECSNTNWDNGYPSGGNYWSDFDEPGEGAYDNYNGPNQDIPGGDGIVDGSSLNPYSIPGGDNQDRYPLIPHWNTTLIPPTCSLYGNPASGNAPLTVTFSMDAHDTDGTIASWSLDINNDGTIEYFGMGNPPSMQQHTYTSPGSYTAAFLVIDNDEATDSDTQTITVTQGPLENQPPEASFSFSPVIIVVDETIFFDASSSIDPDGSLISYEWDFNNDGIYDKTGITTTHIWSSAGEHHVSLRVTDNNGATDIHTKTLTVILTINTKPICSLTVNPTSGTAPLMVTFTLSASDSDGSITSWKLDINNDGTTDYSGSGTPPSTQQHTYQTTGVYTTKLTVTDNDGATNSATQTITVNQAPPENQPPLANFTYSSDAYNVTFTDASEDPDGNIIAWYWDFGDTNSSTLTNPTHTYQEKGSYTVTVTVTDNNEDTDTYSKIITIAVEDNGDGIPGFEVIPFMFSLLGLLFLARRKRKNGYT